MESSQYVLAVPMMVVLFFGLLLLLCHLNRLDRGLHPLSFARPKEHHWLDSVSKSEQSILSIESADLGSNLIQGVICFLSLNLDIGDILALWTPVPKAYLLS